MNWMKSLRAAALTLACATLSLSPIAEGAKVKDLRREQVKNMLRASGFDNPKNTLTVGEFYRRFRDWYPAPLRTKLDSWVAVHRLEMMPQVNVSTFKDTNGQEQTRLHFSKDGQSFTVSSGETKEGQNYVQIGNTRMTANDLYQPDAFAKKLFTKDDYLKRVLRKSAPVDPLKASIVMTAREYANMTPGQRGLYFLQLRQLVDLADRILETNRANETSESAGFRWAPAYELIARWVFGEQAQCVEPPPRPKAAPTPPARPKTAATTKKGNGNKTVSEQIPSGSDNCIVAGYVTRYDERGGSCGGKVQGRADWEAQVSQQFSKTFPNALAAAKANCNTGNFPCNPLVYGFQSNGSPYCVSSGEVKYATRECNGKSPLTGKDDIKNAQRIVESWVKAQGKNIKLRFNDKGELHEEDYALIEKELTALNSFIDSAVGVCATERGKKITAKRVDQKSACEEIEKRKMALARFMPKKVEGIAAISCTGIPGAVAGPTGDCLCEGDIPPTPGEKAAPSCPPPVIVAPAPPPVIVAEGTNWTPWIIGGALVAGGIACILWCFGDDNKVVPPVYVPPNPPPGNNPDPVPQDPCVVNPSATACQPPPPPCEATNTCNPPPPPPPPAPTDETGSGKAPPNGGGVR